MTDLPRPAAPPTPSAATTRLDEPSLAELIVCHGPRLARIARAICGDADLAEDVVQETFLRARTGSYVDDGRVEAWLVTIASRLAIDLLRRRRPVSPLGERPATTAGPAHVAAQAELARRVRATLDRLPPQQRAALVLRDLEGYPGAEVARILGCRPSTMRVHLARARLAAADALGSAQEDDR